MTSSLGWGTLDQQALDTFTKPVGDPQAVGGGGRLQGGDRGRRPRSAFISRNRPQVCTLRIAHTVVTAEGQGDLLIPLRRDTDDVPRFSAYGRSIRVNLARPSKERRT
jgi:hypothetical protein